MVDGQSGIPRGEETTPPIAHATAAQALAWRQRQAASADQLLEKWAAQGQTGRASEAGTGGGWARPAPLGGACSISWQRFSEQLVLSKAFLQ